MKPKIVAAVFAGLCAVVGLTAYLGGYLGSKADARLTDAQLIGLYHDLGADCMDDWGEHAKLACKRAIAVLQEIENRGLVK